MSAAAAAALTGTEVKGVEDETDTGEDVKYEDGTAVAVVGLCGERMEAASTAAVDLEEDEEEAAVKVARGSRTAEEPTDEAGSGETCRSR